MSYGRLLLFYVSHPGRLASLIGRAAPSAFELRPPALGNFEKSTGAPPRAKSSRFAFWSGLRARLAPLALPVLTILLATTLAAAALGYRHASPPGRLAREGILLLVLMASVEFLVCILADSLFGLSRHLYLFQALTDLLFVAVALRLVDGLARRRLAPAAGG